MSDKVLIDTNILVYAYDRAEPQKQQKAILLLDQLIQRDMGALTTQILAEFFVTVTRKLTAPLSPADAYTRIEHFLLTWTIYETSGLIVLEAARGVRDHQLSYWDAQIWATARLYQLPIILSEDFSSGSLLEGVRFVNPFDPTFQIDDWR
ncbi:PIN domain-containing protein [Candidatus Oscillochloris fontis]|uniref:PIN domain-containing protein n=1 Tax=Candidatus Oscillochloris fontis TaxID=2496868 RepID=UPI00101D9187|nr:PIN domain-containing protein [Candidatus Oscillochloris fontis]